MKRHPKFNIGTRIAITFTIISMVGFSALNLLNIQYYKKTMLRQNLKQAEELVKLKVTYRIIELPDDIIVSYNPINKENLILIDKLGNSYYYFNNSSINEDINKLAIILFGIESILFICLMLLNFQFTNKFITEIETNERFLNLLLLSFNHKICNFLSSQRINIDIVKQDGSERAIQRLEAAYLKIEEEMTRTLQLVKTHPLKIREQVSIDNIISQTINYFENDLSNRMIFYSKSNLSLEKPVLADEHDIRDILYNLMDNAVKYSINYINIRLSFKSKGAYIYIANDIVLESHSGTGLGLEIVETILKRYNGRLSVRRKNSYIVQVYISFK
ncbi:MAG: HAMP domain-containing histidine kinase [Nitrospirae bacterium]|nr:HAMP domain-containing histidine kinase [Nitrospirota bacterium]MBF0542467.1 HAMP domain-containing histidine kinase [Nitrospirota bacterium]